MLQYLVVLLDDTSVSFCDYDVKQKEPYLMPLNILQEVIKFGMKENLIFQFVYPEYEIPSEYSELIEYLDHTKIKPMGFTSGNADVFVIDSLSAKETELPKGVETVIVKNTIDDLLTNVSDIKFLLEKVGRVNLIVHQPKKIDNKLQAEYQGVLNILGEEIEESVKKGTFRQLNILTDRLFLEEMNNCGVGDTTITVAPDGKFYICPAFYQSPLSDDTTIEDLGSIEEGLKIPNPQLYKLSHAPICRTCDAFHCRRCIWLNKLRTLEVNTPGKTQCVMSHIERNVSSRIKKVLKDKNDFTHNSNLDEDICLDPFEKLIKR